MGEANGTVTEKSASMVPSPLGPITQARKNDPATVNPDCTGAVSYEVTVGGQAVPDAHFEYVIVDNGREVKGFPVDAGYAVSCQLILEK